MLKSILKWLFESSEERQARINKAIEERNERRRKNSKAYDFKSALELVDEIIPIGNLYVPSGKIVAGDPFWVYSDDLIPFKTSIKSGYYPVEILIHKIEDNHYRIAFARIKVSEQVATSWKLAVSDDITEEEINQLYPGEFYGYGVDAGTGFFADLESAQVFKEKCIEYDSKNLYYDEEIMEELESFLDKNSISHISGLIHCSMHFPNKNEEHNIAIFTSGWGDGSYGTYWGLDDNGNITELITNFNVIPKYIENEKT